MLKGPAARRAARPPYPEYLWGMRPAALLLFLAACGGASEPAQEISRPSAPPPAPLVGANLVLITLDTVRADHLASYGYIRETTPNLDRLARESVLFERCMAPMSTTLPSHTSMLTGVWPVEHGVMANIKKAVVYEREERLVSLAELMRDAGYDCAAFVAAFPLRASTGLSDGFDVYGEPQGKQRERSAEEVTEEALAWLEQRGDTPYFLWVHYFDPHNPYERHPETGTYETDDDLRAWLGERSFTLLAHREMVKRGRNGRLLNAIEAANRYDEELRYMDHHLGRLLERLRGDAGWERTVVAVVGDHGDGLNQHGTPGHGHIWNEQLHVPFILRVPGMAPGRFGHGVSVVDLTATALGRLEVSGKETFARQLRGVDVLDPAFEPRPIVATTSARKERTENLGAASVITDRWKYVRHGSGGMSLYDMAVDPHELHDVSVLYPDVCEELDSHLSSVLAGQASRGGGRTRPATQEEIDGLEALGYGGGDR
jgi:arylsulfatase A-like enzyme